MAAAWRTVSPENRRKLAKQRELSRKRLIERVEDDAIFAACAYITCADGRPSPSEESFILDYLASNSRGEGDYVRVTAASIAAVTKDVTISKLRSYRLTCRLSITKQRRLIDGLLRLASCDQPLNDHELEAVREIAEALGFPIEKHTSLRRLLGLSRPASGKSAQPERFRREGRDRSAPPAPHQWCYDTLGCSEKDSDETVKRAYRRLAATLHPDKHAGESREPDSLLAHQRDFQRLQDAYTILKRLRPALR
jgi:DnaJ-domain-containing protein 1